MGPLFGGQEPSGGPFVHPPRALALLALGGPRSAPQHRADASSPGRRTSLGSNVSSIDDGACYATGEATGDAAGEIVSGTGAQSIGAAVAAVPLTCTIMPCPPSAPIAG